VALLIGGETSHQPPGDSLRAAPPVGQAHADIYYIDVRTVKLVGVTVDPGDFPSGRAVGIQQSSRQR
jgi:hypothetical protein